MSQVGLASGLPRAEWSGDPLLWAFALLLLAILASLLQACLLALSPARLLNRLKEDGSRKRVEADLARLDDFILLTGILRIGSLLGATAATWLFPAASPTARYALVALLFLLAVLLCEALPSAIASRHSEAVILNSLAFLRGARLLFLPLLVPLQALRKILAGTPPEAPPANREELADEIRAAVEDSDPGNALHEEEKEWIENIVELRDIDVAEAMTPRTDMVAIEGSTSLLDALRITGRAGHSRLPVYEARLDNIVGIFYVKDAIAKVTERQESLEEVPVRTVIRPPYFVPESKRIADLLREFRTQRIQVAVVLDEYGGTAGLITIEDILEEIVGEIDSEHSRAAEGPVKVSPEGVIEVDAKMRVAEVNEEFGLSLEQGEDYDTLGGYVFSHLGRVPRLGDTFVTDNVEITVLKADARRIGRLRLRILSREAGKVP